MAGAQREERHARLAGTGVDSASLQVWVAVLCASMLLASFAIRTQAEPAPPVAGPAADARKNAPRNAGPRPRRAPRRRTVPEKDRSAPVAPAPFVPAVAPTPVAPPEKLVIPLRPRSQEPVPALQPVPTPDRQERDAGAQDCAPRLETPAAAREQLDAGAQEPAPRSETPAGPHEQADAGAELPARQPEQPAAEEKQPRHAEKNDPPFLRASTRAPTAKVAPRAARAAAAPDPPRKPSALAENRPESITLDIELFDRIRREIKGRLPYFQACADAARRRGSPDVRRVQATWCVAADGVIKELRLEGVRDQRLATCITRMGNRPFEVKPGVELTIPTPIVFVR